MAAALRPRPMLFVAAWLAFGGLCAAQEHAPADRRPEHNPAPASHTAGDKPADRNGAAARPTHAPQPTLPPLAAWRHVRNGNETYARHLRDDLPPPRLQPRPSGAGRYVCAVVLCADHDGAVAPLLGLAAEDVLVIRVPGTFLTAESAALIERAVAKERVPLVLLLAHRRCESLRPLRDGERQPDAIDRRREAAARDAERLGVPLRDALLRGQRELLLATSPALREAADEDRLRVLPGVLDDRTAVIDWRHRRSDELPIAPVK
ncbi:MAG: hypothetical protein R3F29_14455 [Planctomycetota bacterium]